MNSDSKNNHKKGKRDNESCFRQLKQYPDVLNVYELCDILDISLPTAYKLLSEKKIQCIKVGREYRIPKSFLCAYLGISEK